MNLSHFAGRYLRHADLRCMWALLAVFIGVTQLGETGFAAPSLLYYSGTGEITSSSLPGVVPGENIGVNMHQNPNLPDLDPEPSRIFVIDPPPCDWHWLRGPGPWDWLEGFELEAFPGTGLVRVNAILDGSPGDMGMSPLGTRFETELQFAPGSFSNLTEVASAPFVSGALRVIDPSAGLVLTGSIDQLSVTPIPEPAALTLTLAAALIVGCWRRG
jgi:hypothetical protein